MFSLPNPRRLVSQFPRAVWPRKQQCSLFRCSHTSFSPLVSPKCPPLQRCRLFAAPPCGTSLPLRLRGPRPPRCTRPPSGARSRRPDTRWTDSRRRFTTTRPSATAEAPPPGSHPLQRRRWHLASPAPLCPPPPPPGASSRRPTTRPCPPARWTGPHWPSSGLPSRRRSRRTPHQSPNSLLLHRRYLRSQSSPVPVASGSPRRRLRPPSRQIPATTIRITTTTTPRMAGRPTWTWRTSTSPPPGLPSRPFTPPMWPPPHPLPTNEGTSITNTLLLPLSLLASRKPDSSASLTTTTRGTSSTTSTKVTTTTLLLPLSTTPSPRRRCLHSCTCSSRAVAAVAARP